MHRWTRRSVLASGLALAACALERAPMSRIDAELRLGPRPPLVLIPGAFGSSLRDRRTGKEVWPASDPQLLLGRYPRLELPIDPRTLEPVEDGLEAYAVFREALGRDFYGRLIDALERIGGYRRCRAGERPPGDGVGCLYPFLYDFRFDNVRAARALDALIAQIRADHADPELRVDVLAHSNGGLVARYYARYGTADLPESGPFAPTHAGAAALRRLLLVGTPNLGTIQPVLSLLRGEEIGLGHIAPHVMASCPGLTQLMPHPGVPWLTDLSGRPIEADLYDIATWRELGWSLFDARLAERSIAQHGGGAAGRRHLETLREFLGRQLARGRRFAESLCEGRDAVHASVFGGDCVPTLARLAVERVGGRLQARERVRDIAAPVAGVDYDAAMFEPGDGVVTRASLLGRTEHGRRDALRAGAAGVDHVVLLCGRHQQLPGHEELVDDVLHELMRPEGPGPA